MSQVPNPTEKELSEVKFALQKLWDLDHNRLTPGTDYDLNLPIARKRSDNTPLPLFKFVSDKASKIPTYQLFYHLLDNYIPQTGIPEDVDTGELEENQAFIKACLQSAPMIYTYNYLKAKGSFRGTLGDFEKELHKLWFGLYTRQGHDDSSAFEHVFVGEVRNNGAKAFHNWITLYFYEKSGKIDYEGFVPSKGNENPDPTSHVISLRFTFQGALKPFSTSFVGTSPEFELAMYTLIYYSDRENTRVVLDGIDLNIKMYPFIERGGDGTRLIGSAFPEIIKVN